MTDKRARHRARRSKLYRTFADQVKTSGDAHQAYATAQRVVRDRRRRKARRVHLQRVRGR
jgi:hypothetical protein